MLVDWVAETMAWAATQCGVAQVLQAQRAATRARAVETRLLAQHERARALAMQQTQRTTPRRGTKDDDPPLFR